MHQQSLDIELELTAAAQRIYDVLTAAGGWVTAVQLAGRTGLDDRTMRTVIDEKLIPNCPNLIEGNRGYKISNDPEEIEKYKRWILARAMTGVRRYAAASGKTINQACNDLKTNFMVEGIR